MDAETFRRIVMLLGDVGVGDIQWAESLGEPAHADEFASETIYVICNSGMRYTVARGIFDRVMPALRAGRSSSTAFGHKGKTGAIDRIWRDQGALYAEFIATPGDARLEWLGRLPWIGGITKYHLAKNFGVDVAKPDVHLQRLADLHRTTVHDLCADLSRQTGYRIATVDTLIWRACADGILNSRTGQIVATVVDGGDGNG